MTKRSIILEFDSDVFKALETRAKRNMMSIRELVQDIVRRSTLSYKKGATTQKRVNDPFIELFSREKRGRKKR